ncbi:hypothetical protein [Fundidesulfovibrio agrisoli]|uniref:hypothetical protein n=1 Tax=Fundidesulfovibrio agrisoli TaxID=2922717 RepID=UPI001FADDFBE|nr:hypothetical protein [Fundidesulfovibrio agrisoli]
MSNKLGFETPVQQGLAVNQLILQYFSAAAHKRSAEFEAQASVTNTTNSLMMEVFKGLIASRKV